MVVEPLPFAMDRMELLFSTKLLFNMVLPLSVRLELALTVMVLPAAPRESVVPALVIEPPFIVIPPVKDWAFARLRVPWLTTMPPVRLSAPVMARVAAPVLMSLPPPVTVVGVLMVRVFWPTWMMPSFHVPLPRVRPEKPLPMEAALLVVRAMAPLLTMSAPPEPLSAWVPLKRSALTVTGSVVVMVPLKALTFSGVPGVV